MWKVVFLRGVLSPRARYASTIAVIKKEVKKRVCIVGSGPAGFYAAQYILKNLSDAHVDIVERLPVPFGLVRFGVAPDHPEVKNVINTFSKTAENPRFRFLGNLALGTDLKLKDLRNNYHAVLLTYGAEEDRKLNIPNEDSNNVISARKFVAWYNGLPGSENLNPNLNAEQVTLIGQGNVAIDVARVLLSPIDKLKNTDITNFALDSLSRSRIKKVFLVGRRGPLEAAFTIKELREMLKLPAVTTIWKEDDFKGIQDVLPNLQRPRKRLTELMLKSLQEQDKHSTLPDGKQFLPVFFRSPKSIQEESIELTINEVHNGEAIPTGRVDFLSTNLVLRSIGYKSICADCDINFDVKKGHVANMNGRVIKENSSIDCGLYVAGWLATGPTGVIIHTMNGAFAVAQNICDDINQNVINCTESKPGLDIETKRIVTWAGWQRIDEAESEAGKSLNKPREKIIDIEKMLKIAGV